MTQEEKYFKEICARCEEYSIDSECEFKEKCPAFKLYSLAISKKKTRTSRASDWTGCQGYNDFEPGLRPEMI